MVNNIKEVKSSEAPSLSVIMPVYNAEKYLRPAIESVLFQTYRDFEFIIVNDGSTDNSEQIILSYTDDRIVYLKNPKNLGLITTLNNSIQLAKGRYIARMDNDDICEPNRFELQLEYLSRDPKAKMVCSPILTISALGEETGFWPADKNAVTYEKIVATLPWENCIAHPSILIESEVLKKYRFALNQKGSEDWDLWLRLVRDKVRILKTKEVLLKYRIHPSSFTQIYNTRMPAQLKSVAVKWRFVWGSLSHFKFNYFVFKTGFTIYKDLGYYLKQQILLLNVKKIKWLFTINPFKAYEQSRYLRKALSSDSSSHFMFFPYSHLGGAEKVHAEITKVAETKKPFVFITGIDDKGDFPEQFGKNCILLQVSKALYHPFFSSKNEQLILQKIHSEEEVVVFGCNNLFFYELLRKLKESVYVADLTHDFDFDRDYNFALKNLPNYLRCNRRVFISNSAMKRTLAFYESQQVSVELKNRLCLIYNVVNAPQVQVPRKWEMPFRVLYVGRDTPEKRVDLVFDLAQTCLHRRLSFEFEFVGVFKEREAVRALSNITMTGFVRDEVRLSELYSTSHFVIISSESEGFPLSLAEGMIHGCIPVSTPVGDIPFHISHNQNGLLTRSAGRADTLKEMLQLLTGISENKFMLADLSDKAREYAQKTFNRSTFTMAYRSLLKLP